LPRVLGGIPLDEIGATGYGLAQCAEVAAGFCGLHLAGAKVAIEGFGSVGRHAARLLEVKGARLVAASDTHGAVYDPEGIPVETLTAAKREKGSVTSYARGKKLASADLIKLPCDILIPAARPDCIHADNARHIQAKLVLEGANIPATPEAEAILHERGILVVPDFIANAGGVICAAFEYHGGSEAGAFAQIAEKIRRNTEEVLQCRSTDKVSPRQAALEMARQRVTAAMAFRR
jgi:glutamate dehydrogenase/leucine dehydrogenase